MSDPNDDKDYNKETGEDRKILESIRFSTHWPEEERVRLSLEKSLALIRQSERRVIRMRVTRRIAAVLVGAMLTGAAFYLYRGRTAERLVATGYGALKTIYLPDSSQIVLNAHSTLRYKKNWKNSGVREVWLDGEAFFDVRHPGAQSDGERFGSFLVHTGSLDVQVLGTAFDIRKRRGVIEVVLETGKIRVFSPDAVFEALSMTPGDKITFDSAGQSLSRNKTAADNYSSWKDKKLVLTNARLGEIIGYLEDNYGKRVVLQDPRLADRTIGGEVDIDNLQDALFVLSKTLNLDIRATDSTLLFQSK
jgi:transmembrane sensor